jgi:hypothetical protein
MSRETDALERDVERSRADLEATLDALKSRASIDRLSDDALDYLRRSGGRDVATLLWRQARDHPLPLLMIGAGIVWLAADQGRRTGHPATAAEALRARRQPASGGPEGAAYGASGPDEIDEDPFVETGDGSGNGRWSDRAMETVEEHPLWSSGAGFAIGLALGAVTAFAVGGRDRDDGDFDAPLPRPLPSDRAPVETNAVPPAQPEPRRTAAGSGSKVDESLDETFPASDPPSHSPGTT